MAAELLPCWAGHKLTGGGADAEAVPDGNGEPMRTAE